jgi:hypothetical protein
MLATINIRSSTINSKESSISGNVSVVVVAAEETEVTIFDRWSWDKSFYTIHKVI